MIIEIVGGGYRMLKNYAVFLKFFSNFMYQMEVWNFKLLKDVWILQQNIRFNGKKEKML